MPAQRVQMRRALEKLVITPLKQQGFEGEYPHFRRVTSEERIELLVFSAGKYGNCFSVGGSVIFPKEAERYRRNFSYIREDQPLEEVNTYSTYLRETLPGMFDGAFYYTDVYEERFALLPGLPRTAIIYEGVSARRAAAFQPGKNQRLVQKYDESTCTMIAEEVNRQLPHLMRWYAKMQTPADLIREHRRNSLRRFKFYRWIEEKFT